MDEMKICPMFIAARTYELDIGCECRKEMCEWYIVEKQKCAISLIGGNNYVG